MESNDDARLSLCPFCFSQGLLFAGFVCAQKEFNHLMFFQIVPLQAI